LQSNLSIEVSSLTKTYGNVAAVHNLSFTANPGEITGFLGPNGAGKTTTLRAILDLVRPTSGTGLIGGKSYSSYPSPGLVVGASLDAASFNPGRTGRDHLRILGAAEGPSPQGIDHLLTQVGLKDAADRRVKTYSLGMRQRLGIAAALLSNPPVLILDEPANGLDPEGIRWMRELLRYRADMGGTVLLSSHLLAEVQMMADRVVIISRGQLVAEGTLAEIEAMGQRWVKVAAPDQSSLWTALQEAGMQPALKDDAIVLAGVTPEQVGKVAFDAGIVLSHLSFADSGLEDVFLGLVGGIR